MAEEETARKRKETEEAERLRREAEETVHPHTRAFLRDDPRPEVPQRGHHQVALV